MLDWYRNTDWNDEIEAQFFDKLSRARSQRDQYIVLQALHLADSHPNAALRLVDLYFDTRIDDFHDDRARRAAASARFALGGYLEALDEYLAILEDDKTERTLHVGSPIEFAFLAARYRSTTHYHPALEHLSSLSPPEKEQPDAYFRYFAASGLLLSATGRDPAGAAIKARGALAAPGEILAVYPDVVWRLRGITRS